MKLLASYVCAGCVVLIGCRRRGLLSTREDGYEEVPPVSTVASGEFRGFIKRNDDSIDHELTGCRPRGRNTSPHPCGSNHHLALPDGDESGPAGPKHAAVRHRHGDDHGFNV